MRARVARLAERVAPTRAQLWALSKRVEKLEAEVQETRRFSRRLAEIADVVEEVLVPAANRDDERLRHLLAEYSKRLGPGRTGAPSACTAVEDPPVAPRVLRP